MESYILNTLDVKSIWNSGFKGEDIKVAVIDNGINEIEGKLVVKDGYNFKDKNSNYKDTSGHGTAIASIIASKEFGIAPECEIYSLKTSLEISDEAISRVVEAIEWCIDNDIDIINMSFGFFTQESIEFEEVCLKAKKKGIILLAAVGNNPNAPGISIPANYNSVIAVSSINKQNVISITSCYGKGVDFCCYGEEILAYNLNGEISSFSGTSYAVAVATGIVALLKQQNPAITERELYEILKENATKISKEIKDIYYGYGLIKAFKVPTLYKSESELVIEDLRKGMYFFDYELNVQLANKIDSSLKFIPDGESKAVKYKIVDNNIAIVDTEGFVTGKAIGNTKLFAIDDNGKVASININVADLEIEEPTDTEKQENKDLFNLKDLNVYKMHEAGIKGKGIKIALVGYGCIDSEYINIKERVNIVSEANPMDANGFGTIYASLISGTITGISPDVELYIVKAATKGGIITYANAEKAIRWCINNEMDIINFDFLSESVQSSLLKLCYDNNIIPVSNAGKVSGVNEAMKSQYSITVSYVTDEKKFIANDSSKVPVTGEFIDCVSYGYGIDVINSNNQQITYSASQAPVAQYYCNLAIAQVIGILALIKQQDSTINNAIKVRELLPEICEPLYGGKNNNTGYGLLKANFIN